MGNIGCGWNDEALVSYAAGRLDLQDRASVEEHLGVCAACREAASAQAEVWTALESWEAPAVSADFDRRLYARMAAESTWQQRVRRLFRPVLVRRALPLAAAACLTLVAVIAVKHPATQHPATPAVTAVTAPREEPLRPEQLESALQDMESLQEFNGMIRPDAGQAEM